VLLDRRGGGRLDGSEGNLATSERLRLGTPDRPAIVGYLLLDGFALMSYAAAIEPLRAANRLAGKPLYAWRHIAVSGSEVTASNGLVILADGRVGEALPLDLLLVCAGGEPSGFDDAPTYAWLRGLAARGVRLGGISGGPYVLARAGLLAGRRTTIHWEHLPAFAEEFPNLFVTGASFEIDGDRLTAAGGVAAFDMMIEVIAADHGQALAARVGDWFLRRELQGGEAPQRLSLRERYNVANPKLLRVLAHLETHPDAPPSRAELARLAGVSLRQLELLFRKHLGTTPARHALSLRLDRARALLRQTAMSVTEVAAATGFADAGHFSRAYRGRFRRAPREERG